jgi:hypothetical protein
LLLAVVRQRFQHARAKFSEALDEQSDNFELSRLLSGLLSGAVRPEHKNIIRLSLNHQGNK